MTFADYNIIIRQSSGQARTTCPQCSHLRKKTNDPCLSINIDDGVWLCHNCGWNGGLKESKEKGLDINITAWFTKRGIDNLILERNQIGWTGKYITFPYFKNGKIVNIKYRDLEKNFRQVKDAEKIFYGHDDCIGAEEIIIVEGEIDKLSLEAVGYKNCLSVPDGAPSPATKTYEMKFSYLETCSKLFENCKKIIIAVDGDPAGKRLEEELIRRLGVDKCFRVKWLEGCKDANEVLLKHGKDELKAIIDTAEAVPVEGLYEVRQFYGEIDKLYEHGFVEGLSTGFMNLDAYYTVRAGEFTVVTGVPSHGKSAMIDALAVNLAMEYGWRFAFFSPENQPIQRHIATIISKYTGKPFLKGVHERLDREGLEQAKQWLNEYFYFILPPEGNLQVKSILTLAKIAVMKHGIRGLILDPWNEFDHSRPAGMNETEYISACLGEIRRFARTYQVHIWIIAHPTKLHKGDDGKYPTPSMYDISGSAHFRNKADNGLCVYRDLLDESKEVEVHIQKVRFREIGKVGMVKLKYDIITGRYKESYGN